MRRTVLTLSGVLALTACGGQGGPAATTSTVFVTASPSGAASPAPTSGSTAASEPVSSAASAGGTTTGQASAPGAARDATKADLYAASIPAYCRMPAQKLVGGKTADRFKPAEGNVTSGLGPVLVDLDGDGAKEIVGEYWCTAGGVAWPEQMVAVWAGGRTLTYDLSRGQGRSQVVSRTPSGAGLDIRFGSYEGAGFDVHQHVGRLSLAGGRLVWKDTEAPKALSDSEAQAFFDSKTAGPTAGTSTVTSPPPRAAAGNSTTVSGLVSFVTPSGLTACTMDDDDASCEVSGPTFPAPRNPCPDGAWGDQIGVSATGTPQFGCHGDSIFGGDLRSRQPSWWQPGVDTRGMSNSVGAGAYALGYGRSLTNGTLTCTVAKNGTTCTSTSGHGFTLSRSAYRIW